MGALDNFLVGGSTLTTEILKQRSRKILQDEPWEDKLTASYTAGAGTITVNQPASWTEGDVAEFDDATDSEARITSVNTGALLTNPISIKAAHHNTTDVNHANGTVLRKNPRFDGHIITEAISEIVTADLWPYVWLVNSTTVSPSPSTTNLYALPNDFMDIVWVTQQTTNSITDLYHYGQRLTRPFILDAGAPSGLSTNPTMIRFPSAFDNTTNPVNIFYRVRVSTSNIPDNRVAELVIMGAAWRLTGAKEIPLTGIDSAYVSPPGAQAGQLARDSVVFQQRFLDLRRSIKSELWSIAPPARKWNR